MTSVADRNGSRSVAQRIIEAVADKRGADPTELEPLYYSIDPDCVEKLFSDHSQPNVPTDQTDPRLIFTYEGHRVRVSYDGAIDVEPIEDVKDPGTGSLDIRSSQQKQ